MNTTASTLESAPVSIATGRFEPSRTDTVRILHVINGEHYSGAERVQDLLAGELPSLGFAASLVCVKPGLFPAARRTRPAPLYLLPMHGRLDLRAAKGLADLVRGGGYRLLHAHTPRTAMLAALASWWTDTPMVYHVHSPTAQDSTRRIHNRVNAVVERVAMRRASAWIAVSESLGRRVSREAAADQIVSVVANGVPRRRPRPPRRPGQSGWTLGTVALFRPRKGMEVLLYALAAVRAGGAPVRLRAVGGFETADYQRRLADLTSKLGLEGDVDWTGFTRDVDAELDRMDAFVLPSLFGEGLPMVVLEAMAAGVPVIGTRVEGVPEAIRDGKDGLLAEPNNAAHLARTIHRLIDAEVDWHKLRVAALERQAETFSERSMAAGVAEVYRRVLARDGCRRTPGSR
jgi:glycosyltransferase involved in cell wall biosynthesis